MTSPLQNQRGFTLVELLTACAVIAVLAAFAIPQYASYRAECFNSLAANDIRSLAYAQEAHFANAGSYADDPGDLPRFRLSPGVEIQTTGTAGGTFIAKANHEQGSRVYYWDSANGGMQDAS